MKIFQDSFEISDLDRDGKKFERVSRITAINDNKDIELLLDVNTEIYQMNIAEKIQLLCTTLLDESNPNDMNQWRSTSASIADDYEYVMHGKVYKFEESPDEKVYLSLTLLPSAVYISYGGLLMCLAGPIKSLDKFIIGDNVYLLLRK